jgi:hypothetical protein
MAVGVVLLPSNSVDAALRNRSRVEKRMRSAQLGRCVNVRNKLRLGREGGSNNRRRRFVFL